MIETLIDKYKTDSSLKQLGNIDELKKYLNDEIEQSKIQNFDLNLVTISNENNNNILYHYLNNKAPVPNVLHHKWQDGDYPDIDADFSPRGRDSIRAYLEARYGKANVMGVATFAKSTVRGALQDIGETLGIPRSETIPISTKFNDAGGEDFETIEEELDWLADNSKEASDMFEMYPKYREWIEKYSHLNRSMGKHAAALVVSSTPIGDYLPIIHGKQGPLIGLNKEELQSQGAIKYDFLGLTNIDILAWAAKFVKERHGLDITSEKFWHDVGYDCKEAYQLACDGELDGIFQMEGVAGRVCVNIVQPVNFDDLAFVNAGMRPGAANAGAPMIYKKHRLGQRDKDYPDYKELRNYGVDEALIEILDRTYGTVCYQEQIMLFLHHVGGISLPGTNKVRKVITKAPDKRNEKHDKILEDALEKYYDNAINKLGMLKELAKKWWETVVGQAGYSFNASHCVAYAILAYRELYIKQRWTSEFFAALIQVAKNVKKNDKDKTNQLTEYIAGAKRMGVDILPVDVNKSKNIVTFDGDSVRLGFDKLKFVSNVAMEPLVSTQPYGSLQEYIEKTNKTKANNKRVIEALVLSGAMDCFGRDRNELMDEYYEYKKLPKWKNMCFNQRVLHEVNYIGYSFGVGDLVDRPSKDPSNTIYPLEKLKALSDFGNRYCIVFLKDFSENKIKSGFNKGKKYLWLSLDNYRSTVSAVMWSGGYKNLIKDINDEKNENVKYFKKGACLLLALRKKNNRFEVLKVINAVSPESIEV